MIVSTFTTNSQFTYSKHTMKGKRENRFRQATLKLWTAYTRQNW
jgi:hypothetical protein